MFILLRSNIVVKNKDSNIDSIKSIAKKIARDKKAILDYSKGLITKEQLEQLGVRLTMPI